MNESEIPVGWIMGKMAEEDKKWEASGHSIRFHKDRMWALKYVIEEWVEHCAETEMNRLGMGSN